MTVFVFFIMTLELFYFAPNMKNSLFLGEFEARIKNRKAMKVLKLFGMCQGLHNCLRF